MEQVLVLVLSGVTSAIACGIGVRGLGLSRAGLPAAFRALLLFAGTTTVFFIANLGFGLALILAVRSLTATFLSTYLLDDVSLLGVSALQGLAFECWRAQRWAHGATSGAARRPTSTGS